MSNLTASEVLTTVTWLETQPGMQDLLQDAARRDKQLNALQVITLPDHQTRGGITFGQPGARPWYVLNSIINLEASYPTRVTLSVNDESLKVRGDKVKKWLAIVLGRLNEGGGLDADTRYRQGANGFCCNRIEYTGLSDDSRAGDIPFKAHVDDIYSLSFPPEVGSSGSLRPSMLGRRFTMLCEEAEQKYTKAARLAPSKNGYAGKQLKNTGTKGKPAFEWRAVSADVATNPLDSGTASGSQLRGLEDRYEACKFVWLDDGETTYVVAENAHGNDGKDGGTIVWQGDNRTKGTSAVIVAGHTTPSREPRLHYVPSIWPLLQASAHIDFIRTTRMTKSINSIDDVFVEQNPEWYKWATDEKILQPSMDKVADGAPGYTFIKGVPHFYNRPSDDDLDKLEQSWTIEADRYSDTHLSVTSADVLEKSTLGAVQLALGQRAVQQTRQLQNGDRGKRELLLMVIETMIALGDEGVTAYARGGELAGDTELTTGASVTLTASDLLVDGKSDWFEIDVVTASMSPSEQRMLLESEALAVSFGVSTHLNMLKILASDMEAAVKEQMRETVRKNLAPMHLEPLMALFVEDLRLSGGVLVQMPQPQLQAPGTTPAGGQQPRPTPQAGAPAAGGSSGGQAA